jgi:peptidoglycan/xylan/chitin deacetylase (PgdA/CDA1 family)
LDCIRREVQQTSSAITEKLGVAPTGFRTPGGFNNGLEDVPAVQELLSDEGMQYASARYYFPVDIEKKRPSAETLRQAMETSIDTLQPYRYPNGLPELALAGITDIWAFRVLDLDRWEFIDVLKRGIDHAHANQQVLSLCFHPPVLAVRDPHCDMLDIVLRYALEKPGGCWVTTNQEIIAHTLN